LIIATVRSKEKEKESIRINQQDIRRALIKGSRGKKNKDKKNKTAREEPRKKEGGKALAS